MTYRKENWGESQVAALTCGKMWSDTRSDSLSKELLIMSL